MNEEELERQTKKRRAVPEEAWTYLKDRGYVEEALELPFDDQPVEYIIEEIDALAAASPGAVRGERKLYVRMEVRKRFRFLWERRSWRAKGPSKSISRCVLPATLMCTPFAIRY